MSFKEQFPNEAVLRAKLTESWGDFDEKVYEAVGPLEAEYKRVKRRQKIGAACLTAAVIIFGFLDVFGDSDLSLVSIVGDVLAIIFAILALPVLIVLGYFGFKLMRDKNGVVRRFNTGLNQLIFPKVISVFGLSGSYIESYLNQPAVIQDIIAKSRKPFWDRMRQGTPDQDGVLGEQRQVINLLNHAELVTEPHNRTTVDDMISIPWGSGTLFLSELSLKHVTGSGKNRKVKHIFTGYFVSFDTNKPLSGKTFVSTEGDKKGFGHKSFWKGVNKGNDVKETKLEWNDFEELLHVATNNPSEARYVLTTNFMADLYDWWNGKKGNIRISFIGTRMYMLFPDKGIRLNKTIPAINTNALQEYAMTIATPLMHVLHLIEDVNQKK